VRVYATPRQAIVGPNHPNLKTWKVAPQTFSPCKYRRGLDGWANLYLEHTGSWLQGMAWGRQDKAGCRAGRTLWSGRRDARSTGGQHSEEHQPNNPWTRSPAWHSGQCACARTPLTSSWSRDQERRKRGTSPVGSIRQALKHQQTNQFILTLTSAESDSNDIVSNSI